MRWLNLNKTEQVLACIVIFMALGSMLYQFAIIPELRRIRAARLQLKFQKDLLDVNMAETQHRNALNNRVQKLKTEMAQTRRPLFNRNEASDFLRSLSQLISYTGSVLMTITPYDMRYLPPADAVARETRKKQQAAEVEDDGNLMTMPVRIAISGDYGEVIRFLKRLQGYKRLTTISELKIATAQSSSEVDAELMLNLYIYEDEKI